MDIAGNSWLIVGVFTAVIVLIIGACLVWYTSRSRAALREHHRRMAVQITMWKGEQFTSTQRVSTRSTQLTEGRPPKSHHDTLARHGASNSMLTPQPAAPIAISYLIKGATMPRIQPQRAIEALDAILAATHSKRHRAMLRNFRQHTIAEILCDIDATMATMAENPVFHFYTPGAPSNGITASGRDQVRAMYQNIFDTGTSVLELHIERCAVADWGIAGDGTIHVINPRQVLIARGINIDDPTAHYLVSNRIAFFLPHDDQSLLQGEDVYMNAETTHIEKLTIDEIVTVDQVRSLLT